MVDFMTDEKDLESLGAAGQQPSEPPRPAAEHALGERVLRSVDLMAGEREVRIEHSGELYRLRVTRQGKLILYK